MKNFQNISEEDLDDLVELDKDLSKDAKYLMYCSVCGKFHSFDRDTNEKCKKQKAKELENSRNISTINFRRYLNK